MATSASYAPMQDNAVITNRKPREKRVHHHHSVPHIRPMQRPNNDNRQRKLRAKQKPNNYLISTDGTTSGDDGSETKNKQEQETAVKLDQMLKPSNQMVSDLEADCEDNNYTDVDTVSLSGTSNKNEINPIAQTSEILQRKVDELEKQLATVLQKNLDLKEENDHLKQLVASK